MVKGLFVKLSPLLVMCVANLILWLLLRGEYTLGGERGQVYVYFVSYVFYFTILSAFFCIAASLVSLLSGGGLAARAACFALSIPPALFSLVVGLLCLSVAFNGEFLSIIPAVLYFLALVLMAKPELVFDKIFSARGR